MSAIKLSSIRRLSNLAVKAAIQSEVDLTPVIAGAGRDLLVASTSGIFPPTPVAKVHAAHIVAGAIEGAGRAGGDPLIVIRSIVEGTIKGAWESGADVGPVAVDSVAAAGHVAARIGIDSKTAIQCATEGAIDAGMKIGGDAGRWIADALKKAFRGRKSEKLKIFAIGELADQDDLRDQSEPRSRRIESA